MIAGALRLIQDFRNYNPVLIITGVFLFAFLAANCGTVYHLMKRKLGSIMNNELDTVETEWREHYEKTKEPKAYGGQWISKFGFWLDSFTIRFISREWYIKVRRRRDSADWQEKAVRETTHFNELACISRRNEFKRAVASTAFVSDDNILAIMSLSFLISGLFPTYFFPHVHPVIVAFGAGLSYALLTLLLGLHFLHDFLHGVYRE